MRPVISWAARPATADKQVGKGYSDNARMAAFVAAFPMSAPRYAVVIHDR